MATISENLETLRVAKSDIKGAYEEKGIDMTGVPLTQYGQVLKDFKIKGEPNFMPYLVNYVEQEDGTYEMQINDYVEGGEGEKVLIGTIEQEDGTQELYVVEV